MVWLLKVKVRTTMRLILSSSLKGKHSILYPSFDLWALAAMAGEVMIDRSRFSVTETLKYCLISKPDCPSLFFLCLLVIKLSRITVKSLSVLLFLKVGSSGVWKLAAPSMEFWCIYATIAKLNGHYLIASVGFCTSGNTIRSSKQFSLG